ncbi:MAG: 50S ribosomal protein L18 [Candidatus Paceibacterota bacterium]
MNEKKEKRIRRHARVRSRISGTASRPRLSVAKSNRYIWCQLIDDVKGETIAYVTSKTIAPEKTMSESAVLVGEAIAKEAKTKKVTEAVFDRGGYAYVGLIESLANSARKGGLKF